MLEDASSQMSWCTGDRASRLPAMARTGSTARFEAFFDSQFDSAAWRCLSLCGDAEAMRIAVVVGKEKLGLPVVSMFEV